MRSQQGWQNPGFAGAWLLPQTHSHQQSQANTTASKQNDVGAGSHALLPALQEGE